MYFRNRERYTIQRRKTETKTITYRYSADNQTVVKYHWFYLDEQVNGQHFTDTRWKYSFFSLGDCYDDEYRCLKWAKSGECNNNPDYMLKKCRLSCDVCQGKQDPLSLLRRTPMYKGWEARQKICIQPIKVTRNLVHSN